MKKIGQLGQLGQLGQAVFSEVTKQVGKVTGSGGHHKHQQHGGAGYYGNPSSAQYGYQQPYQPAPQGMAPNMNMQQPPPGVSPELWNWFQSVDTDRSGRISVQELQRALLNGNWSSFNEETCRLMVGMFDRNKRGTIDVYEFSQLWNYIQDWKRCFDSFDADKSGSIDVNELHKALTTFGYRVSPQFAQTVVCRFDRLGRNSIQFDDFIQSCVMLHILTNSFRQKDVSGQGQVTLQYEEFLEMVIDTTVKA